MPGARHDLGELNDLQALQALVPLAGLSLIEAGCATGDMARAIAAAGATVLAVEPDPEQAPKNRAAPPCPGVTFAEAGAEKLPAEDGSLDGVLFFRSLHHVPRELMADAMIEAARVLKPGGVLYVAEPGMGGSHFPFMRPFNDETEVRTLAQAALDIVAAPLFIEASKHIYMMHPRHESFATMVNHFSGMSFNPISRAEIEVDEIRASFDAAKTTDGDYVFDQPMLVNLYRK